MTYQRVEKVTQDLTHRRGATFRVFRQGLVYNGLLWVFAMPTDVGGQFNAES